MLGLAAAHDLTLATCDVNTGARLAALFGDDPAAPGHYAGGWVLGLDDAAALVGGSVAEPEALAIALAARVRENFKAGVGMVTLASLSDFDPATGRYKGTLVIVVDINGQSATKRHDYASSAADLRRRAILWGAEFLRLELLKEQG